MRPLTLLGRERERGLAQTRTTGGSARCLALRYFFFPFLERTRFGNHFAPGCIFLACFCASMHILSPTELSELIFLVLVRSLSLTRTVWLVEAGDDATYYKRKNVASSLLSVAASLQLPVQT